MVRKADEIMSAGKLKSLKGPSKKTGMLYDMPTSSEKIAKAVDLYSKAANQYKLSKAWKKAAEAYVKAAELQVKGKRQGNFHAANNYSKAADMMKKLNDPAGAVPYLEQAVKLMLDEGKFINAAHTQKQMAEIMEQQGNLVSAAMAFEKASDYYFGDSSMQTNAHNCLTKAAYYAIDADEFQWAVDLLEKSITHHCNSTKYEAHNKMKCKNLMIEATLCRFCLGDIVETKKAVTRYCRMLEEFYRAKEYKSIEEAIRYYENFDADQFQKAIEAFTSVSIIKTKAALIKNIVEKMNKNVLEDDFT